MISTFVLKRNNVFVERIPRKGRLQRTDFDSNRLSVKGLVNYPSYFVPVAAASAAAHFVGKRNCGELTFQHLVCKAVEGGSEGYVVGVLFTVIAV